MEKNGKSPFEGAVVRIEKYFQNVEVYTENREPMSNPYNMKMLRDVLDSMVMPYVTCGKHLFPLMKGLMHNHYVAQNDFKSAQILLQQIYPEGMKFSLDNKDISDLNSMSMNKDVDEWNETFQPVGKAFPTYQTIAAMVIYNLPVVRKRAL